MSEHNSPMYATGREHGQADTDLIAACPPSEPDGPRPPFPDYRVMYDRGYQAGFNPSRRHACTAECKQR